MRVLVVTPALPLYWTSAEGRSLHPLVTGMKRRGHDIAVLSVTSAPESAVQDAHMEMERHGIRYRYLPLQLTEGLVGRKMASLVRPHSEIRRMPGVLEAMDELQPNPDVVHYEHLTTSWIGHPNQTNLTVCLNLNSKDAEGAGLTLSERLRRTQTKRAERFLARRSPTVLAFSSTLKGQLEAMGAPRVTIAPLVLDYARYRMLERGSAGRPPTVGMIGSMFHRPSRLAAQRLIGELAPLFLTVCPEMRVRVAGWQARKFLGEMDLPPNVELLDSVASASDFLSELDAMVYAPRAGTGIKVKVLESIAYGIPVVTNKNGREGIEMLSSEALPAGETNHELVAVTMEVLAVGSEFRAKSARAELEKNYTRDLALDAVEAAYSLTN